MLGYDFSQKLMEIRDVFFHEFIDLFEVDFKQRPGDLLNSCRELRGNDDLVDEFLTEFRRLQNGFCN